MQDILYSVVLSLIPFLLAVILHEISHGVVAYMLGDNTAKNAGRFKLHTHFDLYGSFLIPLFLYIIKSPFLIGYAKPVPVDPRNFQNPKVDMAFVAIAGPLTNIILAFITGFILKNVHISSEILVKSLFSFMVINLALCIFNMIPIPPLDGSRLLTAILPDKMAYQMYRLEPYGFFLIIAIEAVCSQISNAVGHKVGIFAMINTVVQKVVTWILL